MTMAIAEGDKSLSVQAENCNGPGRIAGETHLLDEIRRKSATQPELRRHR
jgi:hypothetical protein